MKPDHKYPKLVVATITIAAMGQPVARAQHAFLVTTASASTAAAVTGDPLVLSARQHWHSFLKLAVRPSAIVTVKDLEYAFGQKAVHREQAGFYNLYKIQDIVTLTVNDDRFAQARYPSRTYGRIVFYFLDGHNPETCITSSQVKSDLQMAGWVLHVHSPAAPIQGDVKEIMPSDASYDSYTFIKGNQSVLTLGYSEKTNCATALTMESDKILFDHVTHANKLENAQ